MRALLITAAAICAAPVSADAQVMYRCGSNDHVSYGFQARGSIDCSVVTMADAYKTGVVVKELNLVCSGIEETWLRNSPSIFERKIETFSLVNGRWNAFPCLWTAKSIICGENDGDSHLGIPGGNYSVSIDRYSGTALSRLVIPAGITGSISTFKGTCEIKEKPKF